MSVTLNVNGVDREIDATQIRPFYGPFGIIWK